METKQRRMRTIPFLLLALLLAILPVLSAPPTPAMAQSGNMWSSYFYNNTEWAGNPVYIESVPLIAYNWGFASPGPGVAQDMFTATFSTTAFFYAGLYRFSTTADDEITLIIDGVTVIDTRNQGQSGKSQVVDINMWQGNHRVDVLYREFTETAYAFVTWAYLKTTTPPPVTQPPAPPPSTCSPQSVSSLQTRYGDYTPCIQQGLHQAACFQSSGQWDSPNLGSIETEPQIQLWMACTADSVTTFPVSCDPNIPPQAYRCSKTEAGHFPN